MAKVKILVNGVATEVEETRPGLFGELGYSYATSAPVSTPTLTPAQTVNPVTGKSTAQVLAESTAAAQKAAAMIGTTYTPSPQVQALSTPTPAPTTTGAAPELPTPTAPSANDAYYNSLAKQLADSQAALVTARDQQLADTQAQKEETQRQLDEIRTNQEAGIEAQGATALEEKQKKLDLLAEEKTRFDENYNIVQGLAGQLNTLLTQGQELITQQKAQTGLSSIMTPRINQTISDVTAQAGVIQASISAYNGQMNQAQSQLTNSVNVLTSAYSDELAYYTTLNTFYESTATDTNEKLITLTSDEKTFIQNKIDTLESDMKIAQTNAENIKKAMTDPDTALAYASAGVSLTDDIPTINRKLAAYSYSKELADTSNDMAQKGYSYLVPGQTAPAGSEVVTIIDSKGVQKQWYKKATAKTTPPVSQPITNLFTQAQIADMKAGNLDVDTATDIYKLIQEGYKLEEIRQGLRNIGKNPALLDVFDRVNSIYKILGQAKQKTTGFQ